jgi:glucose/arabinose dehydrogenase
MTAISAFLRNAGTLALGLAALSPLCARAQQACAFADADFKRTVLVNQPQEPMKLAVLPDGRVMWTEKRGTLMLWLPDTRTTVTAGTLNVQWTEDQGLQGVAVDPHFADNHWVYLVYDPKTDAHPNGPGRWVSRFTLNGNTLDPASEKKILHVEIERNFMGGCCHQGGALAFDPQGNLYWSIGEQSDYTVPSALTNEADRHKNSLRSAGNTNDLRGKIVRIHPEADGSYTVPEGNLFPKTLDKTRPEIYAMGVRNPFSLQVDPATGWLWEGEVGTDVTAPSADKGAVGYEEINLLTKAAHLGYPFVNGPNEAFMDYDYVNDRPLGLFNPDKLVNNSRFNTGLADLSPAGKPQPALVWWTVQAKYSAAFPFGNGKTAGMVGPTYRFNAALSNATKMPAGMDGKVVFWDHERETIRLLTLAGDRKVARIDSIASDVKWSGIVDIQQGPDGSFYIAEYGHGYYTPNPTAKISRLDYVGQACGAVSIETRRADAARSLAASGNGRARLAFADPSRDLALELPAGFTGAEVADLRGRVLWRSPEAAAPSAPTGAEPFVVRAPASAFPSKGLVLVRYR